MLIRNLGWRAVPPSSASQNCQMIVLLLVSSAVFQIDQHGSRVGICIIAWLNALLVHVVGKVLEIRQ